ncbi:MAG: hypothetical protein MJ101_07635, partial [Clostridia bacterium]|nr:hypothetical protein [Clostridia bacterium]
MADRFMTVTDDVRYSDKAQWVVMPGAARQQWVMYRSHFATKAGNRVLLLISAAEYCVIYLNGMLVSRSFLRSYIYDKAYEVYDVSSAVTDGDNVIAVHACESGEKERCGILCEVKDGDDEVRTEWVCRADDSIKAPCAYMASSASYEAVDMSLICDGWQEPGYDDSEWQMAESLGGVGRYPSEKMHQSKKEPQ